MSTAPSRRSRKLAFTLDARVVMSPNLVAYRQLWDELLQEAWVQESPNTLKIETKSHGDDNSESRNLSSGLD